MPETDCYEIFRRMVFNVLANNTDDHNKNFSFVMSEDGTWRLSPAYDVTHLKSWGELEEMAPEICEFVRNGYGI